MLNELEVLLLMGAVAVCFIVNRMWHPGRSPHWPGRPGCAIGVAFVLVVVIWCSIFSWRDW